MALHFRRIHFGGRHCFKVLVFIVIVLLLARMTDYFNNSRIPHSTRTQSDSLVTEVELYDNSTEEKSNNATFISSDEELFDTILDIRRRNCMLANVEDTSICQELEQCNKERFMLPQALLACDKRLPRALVIGVEKAGTEDLFNFLMMHHMVMIKRTFGRYFRNINDGIDWYKYEMPYSVPEQITMEKGNYFQDPLVPSRIHEMDPDIKMLLMVRDPVDRAIAALIFHTSVDEALTTLNKSRGNLTNISYVRMSIYDEAFKRYLQYFNRSQIHVIDFERFQQDPYDVLKDIETFLCLQHEIEREDFVFNHEKGFYCLRAVGKIRNMCSAEVTGREKLSDDRFEEYKYELRRIFKPHNEMFLELVGRRFHWSE